MVGGCSLLLTVSCGRLFRQSVVVDDDDDASNGK